MKTFISLHFQVCTHVSCLLCVLFKILYTIAIPWIKFPLNLFHMDSDFDMKAKSTAWKLKAMDVCAWQRCCGCYGYFCHEQIEKFFSQFSSSGYENCSKNKLTSFHSILFENKWNIQNEVKLPKFSKQLPRSTLKTFCIICFRADFINQSFSPKEISMSCVVSRCGGRAPVYWICTAISCSSHRDGPTVLNTFIKLFLFIFIRKPS